MACESSEASSHAVGDVQDRSAKPILMKKAPLTIHSLPPELLQEIFTFSATYDLPERRPFMDSIPQFNMTSLNISHVCMRWRSLALATPEMWTWMEIQHPNERCLELVRYYLLLAGKTQGLHLSFVERRYAHHCGSEGSPPEQQWTLEIFKLWISQADRWRSIHFELGETREIKDMIDLPVVSNSLKRVTSVYFQASWSDSTTQPFLDALYTSPALREVSWVYRGPPRNAHFAGLNSVTVLHHKLSWTKFFSLLEACKELKYIEATLAARTQAEATSVTRVVTASALETLRLPSSSLEVKSGIFLDYIRAPNLRESQLVASRSDSGALRRFLDQSGCRLRKLLIEGDFHLQLEKDVLEFLLQAAAHLTSLEVYLMESSQLSSLTISAFSPQTTDGTGVYIPFPSLVRLSLQFIGSTLDGTVGNMLSSRAQHGALPWDFAAEFASEPQPRDKQIVSQLNEDAKLKGLDTVLSLC